MVPDVVSVDGSHSVAVAVAFAVDADDDFLESSGLGVLAVSFSLGVCMSESFVRATDIAAAAAAAVWFLMIARS